MLRFQKTSVYQKTLATTREVLKHFERKHTPLRTHFEEESISATTKLAKALAQEKEDTQKLDLDNAANHMLGMVALLDVAEQRNQINPNHKQQLAKQVMDLHQDILDFKKRQKKILILSANVGHGHIAAANAVREAIHNQYGCDYRVEIVDFIELLGNILSRFTKTSYENSVKFAPPIYKFLYESTDKNVNIVKLFNQLNYPLVITKLKKFFKEQQADVLISTYPFWDYLAAEVWKKYRKDAKFINIITDSITVHNSWVIADTDFHIVANEDTANTLRDLKVPDEKIKVLGFPIRQSFYDPIDKKDFLTSQGLNHKNFTILFLPTSQNTRKNEKIVEQILELDNVNVVIITGRDSKLKPKLEKFAASPHVKVLGWTDQMATFIKSADVVITKAGGATVMECIAAQKPTVITSIIPGQEEGNAELIKRHKLGIIAHDRSDDVAESAEYIRKNYSMFQRNISKHADPEAALNIAKFIIEEILNPKELPRKPYSDPAGTAY